MPPRVVRNLCDRVLIMCEGRVVERGPVREVFESPVQEYTRRLIDAIPRFAGVGAGQLAG